MSFRAVHWALHEVKGLRPAEKLLLIALSEYADDRDRAWPSQETLADVIEASVSTVRRALRRLEGLGLLDREERWVMDAGGDTHRATNAYLLHVGALPGAAGGTPSRGPVDTGDGGAAPIPVNLTGMGRGSSDREALFVGNADTGQSDRYGAHTSQKRGAYRSPRVTGITTPNHQENHQTRPDASAATGSDDGRVGSGRGDEHSDRPGRAGRHAASADGADRTGPVSELEATDRELLAACLPSSMRALDAAGAALVVGLLRERVSAGWRPGEILAVMDRPLPPRTGRLSGLVAYRLRENVAPSMAPSGLGRASAASEEARQAARARRSEEIAAPAHTAPDPVFSRAMEAARAELPDGSFLDVARRAREIADGWAAAGGVGVAS